MLDQLVIMNIENHSQIHNIWEYLLLTICRYLRESPELQMRRLADLAFLVQMYELAYTSYHTAKRDFGNDQAWMHFAGSLVSNGCVFA